MLRFTMLMLCVASVFSASAQKKNNPFKYGDVSPKDFEPKVYAVDSSANAVYLYDVGNSYYEGNNKGLFDVIFNKHARIRLINKNGFDLATVEIQLYKTSDFEEKLEDLDAATYNIENGAVVVTKVDKNSIFKDKSGDYVTMKFTFPNLKEGSIIEFNYKVSSPSPRYIEPWLFQGDYPRLWSEYSVSIPSFYDFVTMKQGYQPYAIDSGTVKKDNYNIYDPGESSYDRGRTFSVSANTLVYKWAMANVPVLKEEEFTTTLRNYIAKIEFQLSAIRYPDVPPRIILGNWMDVAKDLMKDESFAEPLTHSNNWLEDDVKDATAGCKNDEEKARKIYEFVKKNYSCTDNYATYLSQPLKKTYQSKKGNVADINILLASMLNNAGFEAHPVLLSTKGHGKAVEIYPLMFKFNYVIAQAVKDNKTYLLDASDPDLGFNKLSEECYNGSARVIAELPVLVDLSPDSLTESKLTTVFMINNEKGLSASLSTQLGNHESASIRRRLKKATQEEFFKDIKKGYSMEVELSNTEIDSLKITEEPVTLKYDIDFKNEDEDMLYFSPMLAESYKENPFKAAERLYPVEMSACMNETYILNMEIPKGYKVEELPKSSRVMLNDDEGMFEYIIGRAGDNIQLRCKVMLKKATFEPEDYSTLRDFFAYIVKKQAEQIVFKKL